MAVSDKHKNLMRVKYRAEKLGADLLPVWGTYTLVETRADGEKIIWAHRASDAEIIEALDAYAKAHGVQMPPLELL